jgi:hypothetical protein
VTPRRALLAVALLSTTALLTVLTACAPSAPTTPTPAAATPTTKRFPPGDEIPENIRVRHPKDARGIPVCDMLTDAQLVELGLQPGTARSKPFDRFVNFCGWRIAGSRYDMTGIGVRVDSEHPALLGIYRIHQAGPPFHRFEPTEIAGYPAVEAQTGPTSECEVNVGIADDQLLGVGDTTYVDGVPVPCDHARRIAEAVLANLPPMR